MRNFLIGIAVLIAVLVGVGVLLFSQLDGIVSTAIERFGGEATQSEVNVEGLDIKLTEGTASMSGLSIGNPEGFSSETALSFGAVEIGINPTETTDKLLVLDRITVDAPKVHYELLADGTNNIATIQKNVEAFAQRFGGGGSGGAPDGGGDPGTGEKLIVDLFETTAGEISVSAPGGKAATVTLPAIRLTDLGRGQGGLTGSELTAALLDALTGEVISAVAKAQVLDALGIDQNLPGSVGDAVRDLF